MVDEGGRLGRWLLDGAAGAPMGSWQAIVVLGGHASARCARAAALWAQGVAPEVVLVGGQLQDGVPGEVRKSRDALRALGLPAEALTPVLQPAPGTWEEAGVVAELVAARAWTRVLVVTSPYHCLRAGEMVRRRVPRGCTVRMVACTEAHWERWPSDPRLRRLVVREVLKLGLWKAGLRERWRR